MTISRTVGYAITALAQIAAANGRRPLSCRVICEQAEMPERFVLQILRMLATAGLVTSIRGVRGGYLLSKPASQITVLAIYEAVEGPIRPKELPVEALAVGAKRAVNRALLDIVQNTRQRLESLTLDKLSTAKALSEV